MVPVVWASPSPSQCDASPAEQSRLLPGPTLSLDPVLRFERLREVLGRQPSTRGACKPTPVRAPQLTGFRGVLGTEKTLLGQPVRDGVVVLAVLCRRVQDRTRLPECWTRLPLHAAFDEPR